MLQLHNHTPLKAMILVVPDRHGVESLLVVIKGTYRLSDGALAAEQQPILVADQWAGEPGTSPLLAAHDLALEKPGTDILLVGSAHAPGGQPVREMEVSLQVGSLHKRIRVIGDRVWEKGFFGHRISEPVPFTTMPLTWDRAYGGVDAGVDPAAPPACDARNPSGRGVVHSKPATPQAGRPLPNLEDPASPITKAKDQPAPAGCGPLAPSWQPRAGWAGTYDEAWQQTRAPYLPTDFDPRFFLAAPADQVVMPHLVGGETVTVRGMSGSDVSGTVPAVVFPVECHFSDVGQVSLPLKLDTLVIAPENDTCTLVWRALHPVDKRIKQIETICVGDQHRGCRHV
jgi:hypothetical protein